MTSLELAQRAAEIAKEKKASRLVLLDLREKSDLCSYQLICSGQNERQTRAVADAIEEAIRTNHKTRPVTIEGRQSGHWILMDYQDVLVHVFYDHLRDYYNLESLFPNATFVEV